MEKPPFLWLALPLALLGGLLLLGAAATLPAQAESHSSHEPITGVVLTYTPALVYPGTPVLFDAEIISGSLPVTYTWQFGDGSSPYSGTGASSPLTVSHSYTAAGVYTVALSTWNPWTVPPLTTTTLVTVTASPCLTLTGLALTYTPTQVYTTTEVVFAGQVVTGSLPVTYTWTFGDLTAPVSGTTPSPTFTATHSYSATGTFTPSLSAWNRCTFTPLERALTLTVAPCEPLSGLVASFWPTSTQVGEIVTFTASVSGGSPPWAFTWDLGDGGEAAGMVITHVYSLPLTYTVTLTGWNPCSHRLTRTTVAVPPRRFLYLPLILRGHEPPIVAAGLGYGVSIAAANDIAYAADMGFDWAMGFVRWTDAGRGPNYNWTSVNNQLREFVPRVRHVVLRVHHPTPAGIADPPVSASDLAAFGSFVQALATHVRTTWRPQGLETVAYEIWNEPNLGTEWGPPESPVQPSAAQYTALLKTGYQGARAGDPQAIVISAGLATTGGSLRDSSAARNEVMAWASWFYGTDKVVPDLTFLNNIYRNGAKGYFDALGSHPYGGRDAPGTAPTAATGPIYFRRAEEQRQVMLSHGDTSPIWATEFGWILNTGCDLGPFNWMKVSEAQQAQYLVDAYKYAEQHWPWMGPMLIFNLDFATVYWYADCDPMRWFSIVYRQDPQAGGPILTRQAFSALRDMPKHSTW